VKAKETAAPRGTLCLRVYKNGRLVESWEDRNLIVNLTREALAHLLSGTFDGDNLKITHVHFGTNGSPPDGEDNHIENPYQKAVVVLHPAADKAKIDFSLDYSEAIGLAIHEFGLITVDGSLFARKTREYPLIKDKDISIVGEWLIEF
jgi:hypothetical protein